MIKLIAFDWNGTLLSDTSASARASGLTYQHFGRKPISLKKFRETFTIPIANFWLANGGKKKDLEHMSGNQNTIFNSFYEPLAIKSRTRGGSKFILHWLKINRIQSVIYSNHTLSGIQFQLQRLSIKNLITHTIARTLQDGAEHIHNRTKDKKLQNYIKNKKLNPKEIISVGDTEEEIDIGKHFGYYTVAITGGYNTTARLKKHKPDFLIHNMLELKGIIKKLNKI